MHHTITFDLEESHHSNISDAVQKTQTVGFDESVGTLLNMLKSSRTRATFFIVGETAEAHPDTIRRISDAGHEIAGHSMHHKRIVEMTEEEFRSDARCTKEVLEQITGSRVVGYRAPSWSAHTQKTPWFWRVLKEAGYEYSSSVMLFENFLYGESGLKIVERETVFGMLDTLEKSPEDGVIEIIPSTLSLFGKHIPFSGGFYFRIIPWFVVYRAAQKRSATLWYFHLRDIGLEKFRESALGFKEYIIQYSRISAGKRKFAKLLELCRQQKS